MYKRGSHGINCKSKEYTRMKTVCKHYKISKEEYINNIEKYPVQVGAGGDGGKKNLKYHLDNKENKREIALRLKYGITLEEYNVIFEEQRGCCAICGIHQMELDRPLYVDHDHETNKVRGLLCQLCNTGLGMFRDNSKNTDKATEYLKKYGK